MLSLRTRRTVRTSQLLVSPRNTVIQIMLLQLMRIMLTLRLHRTRLPTRMRPPILTHPPVRTRLLIRMRLQLRMRPLLHIRLPLCTHLQLRRFMHQTRLRTSMRRQANIRLLLLMRPLLRNTNQPQVIRPLIHTLRVELHMLELLHMHPRVRTQTPQQFTRPITLCLNHHNQHLPLLIGQKFTMRMILLFLLQSLPSVPRDQRSAPHSRPIFLLPSWRIPRRRQCHLHRLEHHPRQFHHHLEHRRLPFLTP
jgi:hypothetical protein